MAMGEEQAARGQGDYLESGWDRSLGLNTDEEEDTGKAGVGIKLNLTEVCSWESLSQGKRAQRGWGEKHH